jgi:probable F420-dependent oxidoreductase
MALKDKISFGFVLPHRSIEPIDVATIRQVAQRAEALGFRDLWVTENPIDDAFCLDSVVALTYAAAVTTRIRLGVSVMVLPLHHPIHVAHQMATLDYLSNGRAILGAGLGGARHYADFQIPLERRVRRFKECADLIKKLWTEAEVSFNGDIFQVHGASMALKPVQQPHPPIWFGGAHPNAIHRAAASADGWMGSGSSSTTTFDRNIGLLKAELEKAGRNPQTFPISKRVFLSVDESADVARAEVQRWFSIVYRRPEGTDTSGIHGTPEQLRERIEELVAAGANHLLLNPVCRYAEQLEVLAEIIGLR